MKNTHFGYTPGHRWPHAHLPQLAIVLGAILLAALTAPNSASAAERLVYGRVIDSVPLPAAQTTGLSCEPLAPLPPSASLTDTLARELIEQPEADADCAAQTQPPTAYRVRYRWNNREFETTLPEPPGRRIVLRLSVD